ncbi:MAG: hypothetical protein ACJ8H8_09480, partial [Geminicoccaceae bacterium]
VTGRAGGVMGIAGVVVALVGFGLAVASLGMTSSNGGRLGLVLLGIAVSLFGIFGLINPSYQKNAVWKR